jgi:hypothetical protein
MSILYTPYLSGIRDRVTMYKTLLWGNYLWTSEMIEDAICIYGVTLDDLNREWGI